MRLIHYNHQNIRADGKYSSPVTHMQVTRRNGLELEKANQDEKAEADELKLPVQKLLTSSTSRIR